MKKPSAKIKTIKITGVLISILSVFFLVTGCGNASDKQQNAGGTPDVPQKIALALDWTPNTNHTGLYVALEKGYFTAEGLDVEIIQPPADGTVEQLVGTGKLEFGISAQEQVTTARVSSIPIVSIATILQHNTSGFASLAEKNIRTAKDFENKTYGGWGLPSEDAMLQALMTKEKADFNLLRMINIGEADQLTSLKRDIDLIWIFYGWTGIEAELRGLDLNMLWLKDASPALDYYTPVIITNENLIQNQPELIKRFLKAVSLGYEYAGEHPAESAQLLINHAPEADPELIKKSQAWLSPQYQGDAGRWGEQKESVWHDYAEWLVERSLLPQMIDPAKAFTNQFLPGK